MYSTEGMRMQEFWYFLQDTILIDTLSSLVWNLSGKLCQGLSEQSLF